MSDQEGRFIPTDMELDTNNKMGYIEHISYRLILPDCLPCKRGNGVLDNDEFRMMGEEILSYTENEDVRVGSLINVVLNDLRISSKHHDLSFVNKKEWNKFTKPQVGTVIALRLDFPILAIHTLVHRMALFLPYSFLRSSIHYPIQT